jgi:hypothetical protein
MGPRSASRVFGLAAVFNVAIGASGLLAPVATARMMGIDPPQNPIFAYLSFWLILVFGVGYGLTARRPERNRDLMLLGGLGKLFVLPIMLAAWQRGHVGPLAVGASFGDLVFALLFFDVRRRTPEPR